MSAASQKIYTAVTLLKRFFVEVSIFLRFQVALLSYIAGCEELARREPITAGLRAPWT
jgi:hypothetical protein